MKLLSALILLFISINSYAQFKVEIVNKDGQSMSKECEAQEKCDAYIARVEHKWGDKDRWQNKPCDKPENQIETRSIENELDMPYIEYHCKQNYSVNVKDISVQVEAKKAKKLKGESDLESLVIKIKDGSAKLKDLLEYIIIKDSL